MKSDILNGATLKIRDFWPFSRNFVPAQFQNRKIAKLNTRKIITCRIWDSLFLNIWSKYDIDTRISHISTYSNDIRVFVTFDNNYID